MSIQAVLARLREEAADTADSSRHAGPGAVTTLLLQSPTHDPCDTPSELAQVDVPARRAVNDAPPERDRFRRRQQGLLFQARLVTFVDRGVLPEQAAALAERLQQRDLCRDDRAMCLECSYLGGRPGARRCANYPSTGMPGPAVPSEAVDLLQRCRGFDHLLQAPSDRRSAYSNGQITLLPA